MKLALISGPSRQLYGCPNIAAPINRPNIHRPKNPTTLYVPTWFNFQFQSVIIQIVNVQPLILGDEWRGGVGGPSLGTPCSQIDPGNEWTFMAR